MCQVVTVYLNERQQLLHGAGVVFEGIVRIQQGLVRCQIAGLQFDSDVQLGNGLPVLVPSGIGATD